MITPLGKRILIRPLLDKQSDVIEIPDKFKQSQRAEVVQVGFKADPDLKPGDVVMIHPTASWWTVEHEGETLRIINPDQLLAIMETV